MGILLIEVKEFSAFITFQEFAFQMEIRIEKIGRILGSGFAGPFIDKFIKYSRFGLSVNSKNHLHPSTG